MMPGLVREFDARLQRNPQKTLALLFAGSLAVAFAIVAVIGAAVWNLAPEEAAEELAWDRHPNGPEADDGSPAESRLLAYGKEGGSPAANAARDPFRRTKEAPGRGKSDRRADRDWTRENGQGDGARNGDGARGAGAKLVPTAGINGSGGAQSAPQLASASPLGLGGRPAAAAAAGAKPDILSARAWRDKIAAIARSVGVNLASKGTSRQALVAGGGAGRGTPGGVSSASTGFGTASAASAVSGPGAYNGGTAAGGSPLQTPGPPGTVGGAPGGPLNPGHPAGETPPAGEPLPPQQVTDLNALKSKLAALLSQVDSQSNSIGLEALTDMVTGGRPDLAAAKAEVQSVRDLTDTVRHEFHAGVGAVPQARRAVELFDAFLKGLDGPDGVLAGFDRTIKESDEAKKCLGEAGHAKRLACVNGHVASALVSGPRERNAELGGLFDLITQDPSGQQLLHELHADYGGRPATEPGRIAYDKFSAFLTQSKQKVIAAGRKVNIVLADGLDLSVPTTRGYLDVRAASGNGETHCLRILQANTAHERTLESVFDQYKNYGWVLPPGATEVSDARHGLAEVKRGFGLPPEFKNIPWQHLTPVQTNEKVRYGVEGVAGGLGATVALERIIAAIDLALTQRRTSRP